jgi:hypothetical protein
MLNGTPPSWDRKTQPGLFDDAHWVGRPCGVNAVPMTTITTTAQQTAEQKLRCALLENDNWRAEGQRKEYVFVYPTMVQSVAPSTLEKLARKILQDDLGISHDDCSIDFGCHPRSGNAMMIRVPAALLESKCDVMAEKLQALTATVDAAPEAKGRSR